MSSRGGAKLHVFLRESGLLSARKVAQLLGLDHPGMVKRISPAYLPVVWIDWKGTRKRAYRQRDVQQYAAVLEQLRSRHGQSLR